MGRKKVLLLSVFWVGLGTAAVLSFVHYVGRFQPELPSASALLAPFEAVDHRGEQLSQETVENGATLVNFACVGCREPSGGWKQMVRITKVLAPLNGFRSVTIPVDAERQWAASLVERLEHDFGGAANRWRLVVGPTQAIDGLVAGLGVSGENLREAMDWLYLVDGDRGIHGPYATSDEDAMIRIQNDAFNLLKSYQKARQVAAKDQQPGR